MESSAPNATLAAAEPTQPRRLPDFLLSVRLKYVKLGYHHLISHGMYLLLSPLMALVAVQLSTVSPSDLAGLWEQLRYNLVSVLTCTTLLVFLSTFYFLTRPRPVYLVDFACYKPEPERRCTRQTFMRCSEATGSFTDANLDFQRKILERSGLGEDTYLPPAVIRVPPNPCMYEARKEASTVMFGAIDQLLEKTGVRPKDIGVLVVNCSLFNPTPSLSAMVVNHYRLRGNIVSYNLGGMGCSAGLLSIDLAKDLLQVHPNTYALVISMENITLNSPAGDLRVPPPPTAASAAGGWGSRRSRPVHSVGTGRPSAGVAMEEKVAVVEVLLSACVPSRGGASRSSAAPLPTSSRPQVHGSVRLVVPRPDPRWWWLRSLKMEEMMALTSTATRTALRRVGLSGPAFGDDQAAMGLAPFQGVRSSGSGKPPTAPVLRLCRVLGEGGLLCNFCFFLGLSVRSVD